MIWQPDIPELPMKKPRELLELEEIDSNHLNAMTTEEALNRIETAAYALARAFHEQIGGKADDCQAVVQTALVSAGGAMGGRMGALLIGHSLENAKKATSRVYGESYDEWTK